MLGVILPLLLSGAVAAAANSTSSVVCVAGQCLQGSSNITVGVRLATDGSDTSLLLLPGQYTDTTNPQLLHNMLTSSSASISASTGFTNSSKLQVPLTIAPDAGMTIYDGAMYSGSAKHSNLPTEPLGNKSTDISASAFILSKDTYVVLNVGDDERVVFWQSVPDMSQLGSLAGSPALVDLQSSQCSPTCAGNGVCTSEGKCTCQAGFTGASCEQCEDGFFGPTCQKCPADCSDCDDGITGTGRCLTLDIKNDPKTCNCLNGECGSGGSCTCNSGWTAASNGTACAKCDAGFFLTSSNDCKICAVGCTACADGTGTCTTCKSGFTQDANDKTKCVAQSTKTTSGTTCPDGSFANGGSCEQCDPACETCGGLTSNDCIKCASGTYTLNGSCVSADSKGVCEGSKLLADNNKRACDTCGAKCTSCEIPGFSTTSTVDQLKCTGCLAGSFLSNGDCVDSCPSGSFVDTDNVTCTTCDSSCSTCSGSKDFCLTCPSGQLASNGKCVSSCDDGTFANSGSCLTCHPDCATCSGAGFNKCQSCPSDRPVLSNGRCMPTCSSSEYFDATSGGCKSCDSSCGSCYGGSKDQCLSCGANKHVRAGQCVNAQCENGSSIVDGLGVCLSELVAVPKPSGTSSGTIPSITGVNDPTEVETKPRLEWWQILLMALGCAFIFLVVVMLFRRRMRKQRAKRTAMFASAKNLNHTHSWRWRLARFGQRLFGRRRTHRVYPDVEQQELKPIDVPYRDNFDQDDLRTRDDGRTLEKIVDSYRRDELAPPRAGRFDEGPSSRRLEDPSVLSGPSIYSQVTGHPRAAPDVRQPVRNEQMARYSGSSYEPSLLPPPPRTDAEAYAHAIRSHNNSPEPQLFPEPLWRNQTGPSNNPFRQHL
ncbi:hypothetical protein CYLTODRAFT_489508 [Cylindrobasidium torrendii FP15055 ss-10]|uniref:EGF-like domain-containing protein n=1 Tax=Cylindrobasidium torrendii FP15055 ss-10 TaxID=1314674 RepID=A0A0D7BF09_9AGAR|nr:hypothetical protein CYLTODRAFT_489508 [Cylindrobasidium torrendii FP15055 ss-10]